MLSPWQSLIRCLGELEKDLPAAADGFAAALPSIGVRITTLGVNYFKPRLMALI